MNSATALLTDDKDGLNLRNLQLAGLKKGFESFFDAREATNTTTGDLVESLSLVWGTAENAFITVTDVAEPLGTDTVEWRIPETMLSDSEEVVELSALIHLLLPDRIVKRIDYLRGLENEPGEEPMSAESLRSFVRFMTNNQGLLDPSVAVTPDGYVQAEWHEGKDKHLVVEFLPGELARYAAITPNIDKPERPNRMSGFLSISGVLDAVSPGGIRDWIFG